MTDIVELAARVMEKRGYPVIRHDTWLEHPDSGFVIKPDLGNSRSTERNVRATSTITTGHSLLAPNGVLEYQHTFALHSTTPYPGASMDGCRLISSCSWTP
jgi:hypothetical protein